MNNHCLCWWTWRLRLPRKTMARTGVYPALAPPGSVVAHGHDQRDQGFQGFRLLGEPLAVKPDSEIQPKLLMFEVVLS